VALPANFGGLFLNINGRPHDFPAAYSQQWNFTLDRQFGPIHLETAYVGNKANKLMANPQHQSAAPRSGLGQCPAPLSGWDRSPSRTSRQLDLSQLAGERRETLLGGNIFLVSYTFAKAIDDSDSTQLSTTSGTGNLQDQGNFRAERSRSFQDVKHRLVASYFTSCRSAKAGDTSRRPTGARPGGGRLADQRHYVLPKAGERLRSRRHYDQSNTGSSISAPTATGISPNLPSDRRSVQRFINAAAFRLPEWIRLRPTQAET